MEPKQTCPVPRFRAPFNVATAVLAGVIATGAGRSATASADQRTAASRGTVALAALRAGRYEEAQRLADKALRSRRDGTLIVAAARAEMSLGRYQAARTRLEKALSAAPNDLPVRRALCDVLALLGDKGALKPLLDVTYDDWRRGRIDRGRAPELMAVAAIIRLDDNWQDANDTLRAAVRVAPRDPEPSVLWGELFLEKHAVSEAEASFRDALAADPGHPTARAGMAAVHLQSRYDVAAAGRELEAALRINPRHAGALALRAEMALDGEEFDVAAALVRQIRNTNPHDPGAAWLAAARARLLDDQGSYQRERDAHAAVHPSDGDFFAAVADVLIRHRRIDDARAVAEEGVAADPDNARAQSTLATTLLRLGNDQAGVDALRRAWKRDPYDARTFNLLELYDKVIPGMQTFATRNLEFRVDPAARAAVERVVAPFLEETYVRYTRRYGIQPPFKVRFELFGSADAFAIRTVGMPGIGVDAVCFGRVITSQSPTNGVHNWGMVLAHELAHVFAIELSRSRVPRWFTEGLSELETMRARPEWQRHAERDLWGAALRRELSPLATLSTAFVRARNGDEATRAYAEAAAALDFLDRRFGFAAIREALIRFGKGQRGPDVVPAAMGVTPAELEAAFLADLAERNAGFARQYLPAQTLRSPHPADPVGPGRGAASAAARVDEQVRAGLTRLQEGDVTAAAQALERARALAGGASSRSVLYLAGEIALGAMQADEARQAFLGVLALGGDGGLPGSDGYDLRVRLALAEIHRRDLKAAEGHLRRAIAFDPNSTEARGLLVELLGDPTWHGTREDDRLAAVAAMLQLEPMHAKLARELVFGLARRGRSAATVEAARLAIFIEPGVPELHAALGRALLSLGQREAGAEAVATALALDARGDQASELRRLLQPPGVTPRSGRPADAGSPLPARR